MPPPQLHDQTNQITQNIEKKEQEVELCTNLMNTVIVAFGHATNKKITCHHVDFTLKLYNKTTSMQNHKQIKLPPHENKHTQTSRAMH
jgi:hypothetical protein